MEVITDAAVSDVTVPFNCSLLCECEIRVSVIEFVLVGCGEIVDDFGKHHHMGYHLWVWLKLLDCEVVAGDLLGVVCAHGAEVAVEELEESEGQDCAEADNIEEVLFLDAVHPLLVVPVAPALKQDVSSGEIVLGRSEALVDGVELCPGAEDSVADLSCLEGLLAAVDFIDCSENGFFLFSCQHLIGDAKDLLDDRP
jgi:hypothetical protein